MSSETSSNNSNTVIGVDVGGTNTDVAILQGRQVIGWSKSSTTETITSGVVAAIQKAFSVTGSEAETIKVGPGDVTRVSIGTTHFINAVIKRTGLQKVACIRLCGVSSQALPPFCSFPPNLKEVVDGGWYLVNGGFEYDGKLITEVDRNEILQVLQKIKQDGVKHIAVSGKKLFLLFQFHVLRCSI